MMHVIVLGAGAGGGFPQWNSNAPACRRARAGDPAAAPRTQAGLAISADREHWFLLNAAPDLRIQLERTPALHPRTSPRSSPIAGVVLAGSEIDAVVGLLTLREGHPFTLTTSRTIHAHLDANPMFEVLDRRTVRRETVALDTPTALTLPGGGASGLTLTAFASPGKSPLYLERAGTTSLAPDGTLGLDLTDGAARLLFVPGCACVTDALRARAAHAACLFLDGTLWRDDEMARAGISQRTGQDMGHLCLSGPDGALATLQTTPVGRKILIHINNTNPILLADSPEHAEIVAAGWQVAYDGMSFSI